MEPAPDVGDDHRPNVHDLRVVLLPELIKKYSSHMEKLITE